MIEIIKARVKELEELVEMIPISKSFTVQARLAEAKHIFCLIEKK